MDDSRRSELLELIDDLPVIVWQADVPGPTFTYVSQAAEALLGYPARRWIEEPEFFPSLLHEEDRERTLTSCAASTARGEDHELEYRMLTADGEVRWMHNIVEVRTDADGGVSGIRGVLVDVTRRRQAEEARRTAEAHLERVAERVEDVLWVRTAEQVLYISPAYESVWGQSRQSLIESPGSFFAPVHPEDLERLPAAFRACLSGEGPIDETFRLVHPDGTTRWIHARAAVESGPEGDLEVGIATDVTARREQEDLLLHSQKLESLGLLAGGIAHDFNNILVSVLGNAELARIELDPSSEVTPLLDEIVRAAERASGLCRQMLAYSGRGPFERQAVDLGALTEEVEGLLRTSLPKDVVLRITIDGDLPGIHADPGQVHQVLLNLVINSGDAMPQGGTIRVMLDQVEDLPRDVPTTSWLHEARTGRPHVRLRVTDEGVGMDEEQRKRLFDPFYSTKAKGRGLGMANVLGIVRRHQGAISVDSAAGEGTTITVVWPAADAACASQEPVS